VELVSFDHGSFAGGLCGNLVQLWLIVSRTSRLFVYVLLIQRKQLSVGVCEHLVLYLVFNNMLFSSFRICSTWLHKRVRSP
jgi:hypothetical protein